MHQEDVNTGEDLEHDAPFPLTLVDKYNLSLTDDKFTPHSWEDLKNIISMNRLEVLCRWPSDGRRYIAWSNRIKEQYGSVQEYLMQKRLGWTPSNASTKETGPLFDHSSPIPFDNSDDYKILPNDWPYGMNPGIFHLVVWSKVRLDTEPVKGDLTVNSRVQIEEFVQRTFKDRVQTMPGTDKIMWFKNYGKLQSVPGMDHIHVLIKDVPKSIIDEWTRGEQVVQ